ncbi:VOC family protein [Variovorax guangxiensis]|uniref:Catechol 2,3-dioxygenase n=1 Tax=Variovorax guangxiensis TaxID=1775474 RepID=A0A840FZP7_9BURK|nr:VOC family protein [Variovorax guangxiensis]MBB4225715.1 catechol 2,3-dioxygenase [Variovorax guangxiensis]
MSSPWIEGLRSVSLSVPDLDQAEAFYTSVWRLEVAHRGADALYLRGSGRDAYLLALHRRDGAPQIQRVTLRSHSAEALAEVAKRAVAAGGQLLRTTSAVGDPAGGIGILVRDPHGRVFEVVHGDVQHGAVAPERDRPQRLTHVVLNSHAVDETQAFLTQAFGLRLADRTAAIAFMNCNSDHHTLAIGVSDNDALNHIAFLMPDGDAVMRGGGRMKDAGYPIQWGPGRHGPGNNLFNYFIDPFGVVIEYTAEVEQVDDSYLARGPEDWKWPPGRVDQWGISAAPGTTLKEAQRRVLFAPL